ncbi:MAG: carboxypeptidase-like regulatory domain-containing protein, partial [Methanoregulaceae archaeon]|nr:carboxypeptidase-like regulatory domain-containing protein [Methanoregulaceae archaeon]
QISVGDESTLSATLELDKSIYATVDTMSIYAHMPVFAPGHVVNIYQKGSSTVPTFPITSSDTSISYTIPTSATPGTWLATIQDTSTNKELAMERFIIFNPLYSDLGVHFDRDAYTIDDQVRISYKDLPPGTTVLLRGSRGSRGEDPTKVFEKQWNDRIGSGKLSYQLSGQDINYLEAWASLDGSILGYDFVHIAQGTDYILSGAVYDAQTNVPLPGVMIGISGNMHYTDDAGRYSLTLPAGLNEIYLSVDGYHSQNYNLTLSNPTTSRNWYLVPVTSATGGTLYGATANYADGSPVESAYVRIYNESGTSRSMVTKSGSGYYSFDELPNGSTWTILASKTDYDNYQATVTVIGETLHLVRLVPEDYDPNAPPANEDDSSTGSSTGSSTTSTDERPSRASARESLNWLEETIPGLIKVVVFVFLMALMGMKL